MRKRLLYLIPLLLLFFIFSQIWLQYSHTGDKPGKQVASLADNVPAKKAAGITVNKPLIASVSLSKNRAGKEADEDLREAENKKDAHWEEEQERHEQREGWVEAEEDEENDMYDGPQMIAQMEFQRTKDPVTGSVPREEYLTALRQTAESKAMMRPESVAALSWIERGSNSDVVGPSNGNTRANSGKTSGRIRAVMVDSTDATHKTVWIGGVDGGLWKTTDITVASPTWVLVNDFLSNLAISAICQDPRPGFQNIMYFCTGESYYNSDAVQGNGVFKSTDGGVNWTFLSSTSSYVNCTRILCDFQGNIYLATRGTGLLRSTAASGGAAWTNITPSGLVSDICDLEISSTSVAGRLHVVSGIFSTQAYRYTDIPATVAAATWTSPAVAFPSFSMRAEIAVSGSTLYALPADNSYQVPTIYKSINGGANWAATTSQPTSGWASGQGWYALAVDIDPSSAGASCIVGGLENYKTTDGGATWTKISTWVGTTGQYVHADMHKIIWYDGGNKLLFACDGGIHYSADKGVTIRDRNVGLRLKQFFSVAIHPSTTNYFLAGAQDNGTHQFNNAGLSSSVEVTGGDGALVAIDQNEPQYQFGSYVYNAYRRSTNSGSSWSSCNFYKGSSPGTNFGSFINPYDYDNTNNIVYAGGDAGEFFRWTTAQTTAAGNYYATSPGFPAGASILTGITGFNGAKVSTVFVSPYTANLVYFGTAAGRVVSIAGANTVASGAAGTNITGASFPAGSVSCINAGTNDQNLVVTFSNYNVNNVWVSTNGGGIWTAIDGNLPNMPVRWAMFYPGDNTKAFIATETGVWETTLINGASTVWTASSSFPVVRTDMLKYRTSDGTIAAATHGRGLWTSTIGCPTITVTNPVTSTGTANTAFSQTFTQTGAVGGATFTLNTGFLPTGLTLSAAGVLSGTPTQTGSFPITVKVTDGNTCTGIGAAYTLVISCQTITVTNPVTTTGTTGTAFSQTFTQTGAIGSTTFAINTGTLPTGLSLSSAGVLSGTPTQSGTFPITIKVTDGNGCIGTGGTYNLVINCPAITITNPVTTTGTANTAFSQTFTQTGATGGATFTINTGTLPTGLTLSTTGVLSGTTTQIGSFPITVKVTSGHGCIGTGTTYTLVIGCQSITVANPATTTGTAGIAFSQTFTQTGSIGSTTFTLNSGSLPTGLTLSTAGLLSGTPTQTGIFPITVKVTDGNGCTGTGATYTLVISCQTITVTNPITTTGTAGVAFSQTFTQTGAVGGATFSINTGTLPTGLTLSTAGVLSGTPTQTGSFPITVKVTGGNGCTGTGTTYTLVISCQTITVTNPATTTGIAGVAFSQTFTQTGAVGGATFTINTGVLPTGLTLSTGGLLSGTPTQTGSFPITVKVTGGNGCIGTGTTYTLVISCQTITVTNPATTTGTSGVAFSQTFTQTGAVGGATFTINTGTLPTGLTLSTAGVLSGTPTQTGTFPITVKVTGGNGCIGTGSTYNLVISGPATITVNLKLFLQGYYISSNTMQPVLNNESVPASLATQTDTVRIELHNPTTFVLIDSKKAVLMTDGTVSATFTQPAGSYYIGIRHRNTIETWSNGTVACTAATPLYNFTTAANKAMGDNQVQVQAGIWAFFTGDLNQDEFIDGNDFPQYDSQSASGGLYDGTYTITDMNGDGFIDGNDFPVFDSNSSNGIYSVHL